MLALAPHLKIYVHLPPTDLRKSFDGLTSLGRNRPLGRSQGRQLLPVHGERVWRSRPSPRANETRSIQMHRRVPRVSLGVPLAGPLSSAQGRSIDSLVSVGSGTRQE